MKKYLFSLMALFAMTLVFSVEAEAQELRIPTDAEKAKIEKASLNFSADAIRLTNMLAVNKNTSSNTQTVSQTFASAVDKAANQNALEKNYTNAELKQLKSNDFDLYLMVTSYRKKNDPFKSQSRGQ